MEQRNQPVAGTPTTAEVGNWVRPAAAPRGGPAPATLKRDDGTEYAISNPETYLGRTENNDVQVQGHTVSRQHARIVLGDGQVFVEDLGSTNGTFVNDQRIGAITPLHTGDVIDLGGGSEPLRVSVYQSPAPEPQATPTMKVQARALSETLIAPLESWSSRPDSHRVAAEAIISIRNVVKRYRSGEQDITILKNVSLDIGKAEFCALLGPSGCGKTTTLNMIIGIDKPDSGEVLVGDQAIHRLGANRMARWRGRNVGVVFQFFQLLPTLTAVENVMMPMHFNKMYKKSERRDRAMQCLTLVDMQDRPNRLPSALSGGQQQRVAIARALACDPPIIVADEPTGNLDSKSSQTVFTLLNELNASGKTIVMVTHDPVLARSIPRRIEMLDGEIVG